MTEQDAAEPDDEPGGTGTDAAAGDDAQEGTPAQVVKPHATDAGWLAAAGTTCVVCGVAEQGEAHTATESASTDVIDRCYRLYRTVADRFDPGVL